MATMNSPFPGLDPYLEKFWGDAHHSFITYTRDAIQSTLPDDLVARVEERVYLEREECRLRKITPDARVVEVKSTDRGGTAIATEPATELETRSYLVQPVETTEGFIQIIEADGSNVVTR